MRTVEAAVVAGVAAAIGAGTALFVRPGAEGEGASALAAPAGDEAAWRDRVQELQRRLAALEARAATVEASPPRAPDPHPGVAGGPEGEGAGEAGGGAGSGARAAGTGDGDGAAGNEGAADAASDPVARIEQVLATLRQRVARLETAAPEDLSALSTDELAQRGAEAMEAGQMARGTRFYEALLARDPRHPQAGEAHFRLGMRLTEPDAALPHLQAIIDHHPEHEWHGFMHFYVGQCQERKQDPKAAWRAYEESTKRSGDNPYFGIWARYHLAKLAETDRHDPKEAERLRREALALHGTCDWQTVQSALAEIRQALGEPEPVKK